ncbi:MAG: signal peptidase I [Rhodoferax sp.]|uniref:signal peptidase I n=1 Tax=Rhodoferax sp. TaxID=50421 RepID=UPI0026244F22|nr:signal peptidase I [Rhodoferax sp.]MDD5335936.1 signal peptidase I [Rhodoferax sp.]
MRHWLRQNRGFLVFMLLLGLFRSAVADWNPIPSGSMHPNILEGDVVLVNRLAYDLKLPLTERVLMHLGDPQRGDIVTFTSPRDGVRLIKRIVAVPGDRIAMHDKQLVINGQRASYVAVAPPAGGAALDAPWQAQPYLEQLAGNQRTIQWLPGVLARDNFQALTVPEGQYLMLGDNRDNSADSRYIGLVPRPLLTGKAVRLLLSVDILGAWWPRWERFGQALG